MRSTFRSCRVKSSNEDTAATPHYPNSEEGVRASMESGVLHLLVPNIESRARGKRIQIGRNKQVGTGLSGLYCLEGDKKKCIIVLIEV